MYRIIVQICSAILLLVSAGVQADGLAHLFYALCVEESDRLETHELSNGDDRSDGRNRYYCDGYYGRGYGDSNGHGKGHGDGYGGYDPGPYGYGGYPGYI